uniref:Uncharacterized protein n=1 Tax=Arundo donax TaxID=35708 RepID=A0A0A9ENQ5_ARUDO
MLHSPFLSIFLMILGCITWCWCS